MGPIARRHQFNHAGQLVGPGAFLSVHGNPVEAASSEAASVVPAPDNGDRVAALRERIAELGAEIADQQGLRDRSVQLEASLASMTGDRDQRLLIMQETENELVRLFGGLGLEASGAELGKKVDAVLAMVADLQSKADANQGTGGEGDPPPPPPDDPAKPQGESDDKAAPAAGGKSNKRS